MSVKMMGLVWDIPADKIEQNEKFVLLAYADHADHHGRNIFPGVELIRRKCGFADVRQVQRITRQLYLKGWLVPDGGQQGGRGVTPHWHMPYDEKGDKLSPIPIRAKSKKGDISRTRLAVKGDIAMSPESINQEQPSEEEQNPSPASALWSMIAEQLKLDMAKGTYAERVRPCRALDLNEGILIVSARDQAAVEWLEGRLTLAIERTLPGLAPLVGENEVTHVRFVVAA